MEFIHVYLDDFFGPSPKSRKLHAHKCSKCGRVWQHGAKNAGDITKHTCCGLVHGDHYHSPRKRNKKLFRPK